MPKEHLTMKLACFRLVKFVFKEKLKVQEAFVHINLNICTCVNLLNITYNNTGYFSSQPHACSCGAIELFLFHALGLSLRIIIIIIIFSFFIFPVSWFCLHDKSARRAPRTFYYYYYLYTFFSPVFLLLLLLLFSLRYGFLSAWNVAWPRTTCTVGNCVASSFSIFKHVERQQISHFPLKAQKANA